MVPESQPNTIAHNTLGGEAPPDDPAHPCRSKQDTGEKPMVKEGLGVVVDVVVSARDMISSAVQAVPQAAFAWTGICLVTS